MISPRGRKEENIMTNIIINEKKRTIEMSKKDYASACKFGSEEYVDLQEK